MAARSVCRSRAAPLLRREGTLHRHAVERYGDDLVRQTGSANDLQLELREHVVEGQPHGALRPGHIVQSRIQQIGLHIGITSPALVDGHLKSDSLLREGGSGSGRRPLGKASVQCPDMDRMARTREIHRLARKRTARLRRQSDGIVERLAVSGIKDPGMYRLSRHDLGRLHVAARHHFDSTRQTQLRGTLRASHPLLLRTRSQCRESQYTNCKTFHDSVFRFFGYHSFVFDGFCTIRPHRFRSRPLPSRRQSPEDPAPCDSPSRCIHTSCPLRSACRRCSRRRYRHPV